MPLKGPVLKLAQPSGLVLVHPAPPVIPVAENVSEFPAIRVNPNDPKIGLFKGATSDPAVLPADWPAR